MKIKIEFNCDNAAFEADFDEIANILLRCKEKIYQQLEQNILLRERVQDSNGNTVGFIVIED